MAKRRKFPDSSPLVERSLPIGSMSFDELEDLGDDSLKERNDLPADIAYVSSHPLFLRAVAGETGLSITRRRDLTGKLSPPSAQAVTQLTWAIANPDKFMDSLMRMQLQAHKKISADTATSSAERHDDDLSDLDEALRQALAS